MCLTLKQEELSVSSVTSTSVINYKEMTRSSFL